MEVIGYDHVAHRVEQRAWGVECLFTVKPWDGSPEINDTVGLPSLDLTQDEIKALISERLKLAYRPPVKGAE